MLFGYCLHTVSSPQELRLGAPASIIILQAPGMRRFCPCESFGNLEFMLVHVLLFSEIARVNVAARAQLEG